MLIEHTSGSIEDKPETKKCGGALRRSTRCFNQQSLLGQPTQHLSQQPSKQPHNQLKVNPRKVNAKQQQAAATTPALAATKPATPAEFSSSFFPTCEPKTASKELEPIRRGERMCEDGMSEMSSNVDLIYIHQ